jgi:2,4-dienoyl-CoA reductase-like NADH-dependent reductase (Old Yellow Enzyme family)
VIEIHAAHGYLLHEFYSPLTNKRTDEYGGSFENRIRLLTQVISAVRKVLPKSSHALFVRISASDFAENGWNLDDSVRLATKLRELGVDLIDVSNAEIVPTGGLPWEVEKRGWNVSFSETIRKEAGIPVSTVGGISEPYQAEAILLEGKADLIFMGREFLRNPSIVLQSAKALGVDVEAAMQYRRGQRTYL